MKHGIEHKVRSTEIDVIGHVNNAKYLEYMEWSRVEWMAQLGHSFAEMRHGSFMPVVVSIQINYRKELKLGENITITTQPIRMGKKSFALHQEIVNEAGELVTDAEVTMVLIDAKLRRAIELPQEFVAIFAGLGQR